MPAENHRAFYESQGEEARRTGKKISCSEPTITQVVLRMASDHLREFQTVLDIGCGLNLTYDLQLAEWGKQVTGVEFARSFLAMAPEDPRISLIQADATRLPFASSAFDAVVCSETAEHIPDDLAVISEAHRVLKPGGLLFFTVPNLWNASRILQLIRHRNLTLSLMPGHLREYTSHSVRRLLGNYFRLEKTYPVGFGWTGPVGSHIETLIKWRLLGPLCKSFALTARRLEFAGDSSAG